MLTNDDLHSQATGIAKAGAELATFLKADPTLPPLDTGNAAVELDRIRVRLKKLAKSLKTAATAANKDADK